MYDVPVCCPSASEGFCQELDCFFCFDFLLQFHLICRSVLRLITSRLRNQVYTIYVIFVIPKKDLDLDLFLGAVAWVPISSSPPQIERVSLSRGAKLLLTGPSSAQFIVNDVTDDGTGYLYVSSGVRLKITSVLSPCTKVFSNGELIISKGSSQISIERSLAIIGKLSLLNSPSVSFGKHGGELIMFPVSSPKTFKFTNFSIEPNSKVVLKNYSNDTSNCRWELLANQFVLKSGAKLFVGCHLAITSDKLLLEEKSNFTITGGDLVSNFTLNYLEIKGTFLPGITSVGVGLESVVIHDQGVVQLRTYGKFNVNNLVVDGKLSFDTDVFISGRAPVVSSTLSIGPKGRLEIATTSLPPLSSYSNFLNGSSIVHAQDVTISGEFLAKKLSIDPGWKTLTINNGGKFLLTPVNPFSFNNILINGTLTSRGPLHLKGLSQSVIPHLKVGSSGIVDIQSSPNTSVVHAESVTIAGKVLTNKLSIKPGWKMLAVETTGTFQFDPDNPFAIDEATINGKVTSLDALTIKGLTQNTMKQLMIGSTGVVSIPSKNITKILCDIVTIEGELKIGLLDIGPRWKQLNVLGSSAQFRFEANAGFNIDSVRVSGLLQTDTVFGSSEPFSSQNFTVDSGGTVNIHHRGPSSGVHQGASDTFLRVDTLEVKGIMQSGSLNINASRDVLIASSGRVDVSGGGCLSDQGQEPGKGSSSGGSGANYGGRGGRGGGITASGKTYGDIFSTGTWGSGGGHGASSGSGGRGGGRIRLFVKRTLNVDGQFKMNGDPGQVYRLLRSVCLFSQA